MRHGLVWSTPASACPALSLKIELKIEHDPRAQPIERKQVMKRPTKWCPCDAAAAALGIKSRLEHDWLASAA